MEITLQQADGLWSMAAGARLTQQKLADYYAGKHAIRGRNETYADGNEKSELVTNWAEYGIDSYVGSLTTAPYQVTKRTSSAADLGDANTEGVTEYQDLARALELPSLDVENLRQALVFGWSVELHEFVDGEPRVTVHDPREWVILRDEMDNMVAAIRRVLLPAGTAFEGRVLDYPLTMMTIYTEDRIQDYRDENGWAQVTDIAHGYGRVPVVVWRVNKARQPMMSDATIALLDEYNDIDTITGDDIRNNTNSKLVIQNCDAQWLMDNAETINALNMLPLPQGATASYLTKGNDVERTNSRLERLRDAIHGAFKVPDIQSIVGSSGATSGIALRLKFQPMLHKAASMVNWIKAGVRERVELFNAIRSKIGTAVIQDFEVTIQFVLPYNRTEEWQSIGALKGIVSHRTMLEMLSDVSDPERELEELDREATTQAATPQDAQTAGLPPEEKQAAQTNALADQSAMDMTAVAHQAIQAVADGALQAILQSGALDKAVNAPGMN